MITDKESWQLTVNSLQLDIPELLSAEQRLHVKDLVHPFLSASSVFKFFKVLSKGILFFSQ